MYTNTEMDFYLLAPKNGENIRYYKCHMKQKVETRCWDKTGERNKDISIAFKVILVAFVIKKKNLEQQNT